ncbi:uncharacterized protein LOC123865196 [Maniola jurtina]|uniref:uncharacterized protein LOC123865196 n=1 Tax=Maniola jurtina TaxID=191418 RepID=UPI001E688FCC|nr:uncharacterized protein LOC123865196 [Maniola jurtina]
MAHVYKEVDMSRVSKTPKLQSDSEMSERTRHLPFSQPNPSSLNSGNLNSQSKLTDENVNNDPSTKKSDIVKLLVQEALDYKRSRLVENTRERGSVLKDVTIRSRQFGIREFIRKPTLVRDFTTTDDSNTAFIENTPSPAVDDNRTKYRKPTVSLKEKDKTKKERKDKLPSVDEKESELSLKNRTRILPGKKSLTAEKIETPLNKSKRKLYSIKDDSLINIKTGIYVSETEEDNSVLPGEYKSLTSGATSYKALEKMRKIAAARHLRNRKSKETETATLFDLLKKTVDEEKVVLVDTTVIGKDALYNMSSSSEDSDEDFKRKKLVPRNKAKSVKAKNLKRGQTKSKPYSNPKHNLNGKPIARSEQVEKMPIPPEPIIDLVDERMREATAEALNTSLITKTRNEESKIDLEPLYKRPKMELVPHEKECEIVAAPTAKTTKKRTKNRSLHAKERKNISKNRLVKITDKNDDGETISPLPSLKIEVAQETENVDDSIVMLGKLVNKCVDDSNTSHVHNDEFCEATPNVRSDSKKNSTVIETEPVRNARSSSYDSNISKNKKLVVVLDRFDIHALKSISTVGTSPITAHGDVDEPPPQVEDIDRPIIRRSLDTEGFSEGALQFYNKLTNDLKVSTESCEKEGTESAENSYFKDIRKKPFVFKTPFVPIERLTQKELDIIHLAPSRHLVSDSPSKKERTNNTNTRRVCKSVISPISFSEIMSSKKSHSFEEEQWRPLKISELEKPSNQYDLRKLGKTYSTKDKSRSTRSSQVLTPNEDRAKKLDEKDILASGATQSGSSSVEDWFCQNERRAPTTAEDTRNEVLASVREKLNTTLYEMFLNTRNSMIKMQAQTKSDCERKEQKRKEEFRQLQSQVEQLQQTLAQVDRTSKEEHERCMENMETRTREILIEDFRSIRTFKHLLKADLEAAMRVR